MAVYKIGRNEGTKSIQIAPQAVAFGAGFTQIGSNFNHENLTTGVVDTSDGLGPDENHVVWHHVRDALYKVGELNPAKYAIRLKLA